jgi:D-glycero-D-manno-heptose 1,7-bisphosphate phosphatase
VNVLTPPQVPMLFVELDAVRRSAAVLGRPLRGPMDIEVHLDAVERMRLWREAGGRIVGFAHLPEVARGELAEDMAVRVLWTLHERAGNAFDTLVHCPHDPDAPTPDLARCWCRPPKPGLLIAGQEQVALRQRERYPIWMALVVAASDPVRQAAEALEIDVVDAAAWRWG